MTLDEFNRAIRSKSMLKISIAEWHILRLLLTLPQVTQKFLVDELYPLNSKRPKHWEKIPGIHISKLRKRFKKYIVAGTIIGGNAGIWYMDEVQKQTVIDLINKIESSNKKIDFVGRLNYNRWFMALHEPSGEYIPQIFREQNYDYKRAPQGTHAPRLWRAESAARNWLGRNMSASQSEYKILPVKLEIENEKETEERRSSLRGSPQLLHVPGEVLRETPRGPVESEEHDT